MDRLFVLDSKGLLLEDRPMEDYKKPFAKPRAAIASWNLSGTPSLLEVLTHSKATILLGFSGQAGSFTEEVFALSNPTSSSEALPADILAWTEGRAIVATGSPFPPVEYGGKKHFIGQGNNAFIFPGLGFGAILAQTTEITDSMVMAASQGLSDYTAEHHLSAGLVYPPVQELREVAAHVAARVIAQAFQDGVARSAKVAPENALAYVRSKMWQAKYLPVVKA